MSIENIDAPKIFVVCIFVVDSEVNGTFVFNGKEIFTTGQGRERNEEFTKIQVNPIEQSLLRSLNQCYRFNEKLFPPVSGKCRCKFVTYNN